MEVYTNQFTRNLTSNYTAGSGSISVSAAAPAAVQTGTFRVRLANASNTLLKVTGGASTTTWTVTAEANDANCTAGSNAVLACEVTAGMLDQIRADQVQTGAYASAASAKTGNLYLPTDGTSLLRDTGSAFANWGPLFPLTPFNDSAFSWINQDSATTSSAGGVTYLSRAGGGSDWMRMRAKNVPGSTPYSVVCAFIPHVAEENYGAVGIWIGESGSTPRAHTVVYSFNGSRAIRGYLFSSPTSYGGSNLFTYPLDHPGPTFFKIRNDGTNLVFSYSVDGINFVQLASAARLSFLTNVSQWGVHLDTLNCAWPVGMSILSWAEGT